jgi:hypothetical protein
MLGTLRKNLVPVQGSGMAPDRAAAVYDRHAPGLYQQALLTLGRRDLAEQVVSDIVVAECTRFGAAEGDVAVVGRRLAVAAYWRCLELAGGPVSRLLTPPWPALTGLAGPDAAGRLARFRGALALMVFGGLGWYEASQEAAVSPADLTTAAHAALRQRTIAGLGFCLRAPGMR